ncbi:MAG: AI-2E family transporter [Lachnospiraceae bacterium]|nr:AI-2E family transporter [Lachnospiraceae bacterium]
MQDEQQKSSFSIREAFLNWFGLFLVLVAAIVVFLAINNVKQIVHVFGQFVGLIKPVLYGCVIAYLLNPIYRFYYRILQNLVDKRDKKPSPRLSGFLNALAITLGLLTGLLVIVVLCWLVLPQVFSSLVSLVNTLPQQADYYYEKLTKSLQDNPYLVDQMQKVLLQVTDYADTKMNTELLPWMQKELLPNVNTYAVQLASGVMSVLNVLYNLLIGIIVAIYLLLSKRVFAAQAKKITYGLFRQDHADILIHYVRLADKMFSGFIAGKIVDSTIIGIICFVAMSVLHLPYAVLVSVIVGVTNVIPVFGPYIGAIPSIVLILLVNPIQALYFLILIVVLQQLDGNIIGPAILGESTGLSAFWVLFSILLFGGLWGIIGMLVGVPLFAVIYEMISDYINARLAGRKLSTMTEHYLDLKEILKTKEGIVYVSYTVEELSGGKKKGSSGKFMLALREIWRKKGWSQTETDGQEISGNFSQGQEISGNSPHTEKDKQRQEETKKS